MSGRLAPREFHKRGALAVLDDLDDQFNVAAAALSEFGPQRETARLGLAGVRIGKRSLGNRDGFPFQRAAADGAGEGSVRIDDHAGTRLARRGTADRRHGHHCRAAMAIERRQNPPPHRWRGDAHVSDPFDARMARMIASGVAGASSRGMTAGLRLTMAAVIAEKTESASISGGSPTALER